MRHEPDQLFSSTVTCFPVQLCLAPPDSLSHSGFGEPAQAVPAYSSDAIPDLPLTYPESTRCHICNSSLTIPTPVAP